jgi:hypothetical protein
MAALSNRQPDGKRIVVASQNQTVYLRLPGTTAQLSLQNLFRRTQPDTTPQRASSFGS